MNLYCNILRTQFQLYAFLHRMAEPKQMKGQGVGCEWCLRCIGSASCASTHRCLGWSTACPTWGFFAACACVQRGEAFLLAQETYPACVEQSTATQAARSCLSKVFCSVYPATRAPPAPCILVELHPAGANPILGKPWGHGADATNADERSAAHTLPVLCRNFLLSLPP